MPGIVLFALTGSEATDRFLNTWGEAGTWLQDQGLFSGEGGVIGLAAQVSGLAVAFDTLETWARL